MLVVESIVVATALLELFVRLFFASPQVQGKQIISYTPRQHRDPDNHGADCYPSNPRGYFDRFAFQSQTAAGFLADLREHLIKDDAGLEAQLQLARDRVAVDVRDALSASAAAEERIGFTRREVMVSVELERGERKRFELGDSTLLFVNLREQAAAEARVREIDALADFHKAVAALRAALALN